MHVVEVYCQNVCFESSWLTCWPRGGEVKLLPSQSQIAYMLFSTENCWESIALQELEPYTLPSSNYFMYLDSWSLFGIFHRHRNPTLQEFEPRKLHEDMESSNFKVGPFQPVKLGPFSVLLPSLPLVPISSWGTCEFHTAPEDILRKPSFWR